jgi:hypothetical protein
MDYYLYLGAYGSSVCYGIWVYTDNPLSAGSLKGVRNNPNPTAWISLGVGQDISSVAFYTASDFQTEDYYAPGTTIFTPPVYGTSTIDCSAYFAYLFSSSTMQGIGCVAKEVISWSFNVLFWPGFSQDQTGLNGFSAIVSSTEKFQTVFPFAVAFQVYDGLKHGLDSYSSAPDYQFSVPYPWATSTSLIVYNSSTVANTIGSTGKSLWFNTLNAVIWVVGGLTILTLI